MRLELLQQIVGGQLDVAIVEADDEPDRDHVVAHRVDPRAAELAVLRRLAERPAERVDDLVERLLDPPHLLHAELPDLRLGAVEAEVVECGTGEMAGRSLGEHGHLRCDVGAGLEVAERLPFPASTLVAAANADDATVLDEQLVGSRLGEHERPGRLRLLGEIAAHLRDGDDPVAVVAERRRRRDPERTLLREEVDALARNLAVGRDASELLGAAAEQPADGARIHHRAREEMRSRLLALVHERDRDLPEPLCCPGIFLEQLAQPKSTREAGRTATDDQDADVDALVRRVRRAGDDLVARERRWEVRRAGLGGRSPPAHVRPCVPARAPRASGRSCSDRRPRRSRQSRRWGRSRPC